MPRKFGNEIRLPGTTGIDNLPILEIWFPLQGKRAHSLYCWSFQKKNREVGGQNNNNRPIKVITFSTDYKYTT